MQCETERKRKKIGRLNETENFASKEIWLKNGFGRERRSEPTISVTFSGSSNFRSRFDLFYYISRKWLWMRRGASIRMCIDIYAMTSSRIETQLIHHEMNTRSITKPYNSSERRCGYLPRTVWIRTDQQQQRC